MVFFRLFLFFEQKKIFSLVGCFSDGNICSNQGECIDNICKCDAGFDGNLCQDIVTSSSDNTGTIVGAVLGILSVHFCFMGGV